MSEGRWTRRHVGLGLAVVLAACRSAATSTVPTETAPAPQPPTVVVETPPPPPLMAVPAPPAPPSPRPAPPRPPTFAAWGDEARASIERAFFVPESGKWRQCVPDIGCGAQDVDWGADSLTFAVAFRWNLTHDATLVPILQAVDRAGPNHTKKCRLPKCKAWSDVPLWDSVAAAREYAVTRDPYALHRARAAFDYIDESDAFALGACPNVLYQQPNGGKTRLKTLESDSNYVLAALLLHKATKEPVYLEKAAARYDVIRRYFLDRAVPLYTVYVVDSGSACEQIPRRFFGSVNGNMIQNGLLLADATGKAVYRDQALATAKAVDANLSDPSGLYEDLQAENDIVEPLVEAFYRLATTEKQAFARAWILRNAAAAVSVETAEGSYGRFWGGPRTAGVTTAQQANGTYTLAFAAAALAPTTPTAAVDADPWAKATFVAHPVTSLPAKIEFTGSAIALVGAIGEVCCESGHARLFVDGVETFDHTGIWQNKSCSGHTLPDSLLFSWRWPTSGPHVLEFSPGEPNPKEGASFLHLLGYEVVP